MPMSSALTAPTMKSSIKCTRTLISHCNSIINCAIGNTPTTACAPTSRSPTSPHWNSSPVGKLIGERQSVTNLLDEYMPLTSAAGSGINNIAAVAATGGDLGQLAPRKKLLKSFSSFPEDFLRPSEHFGTEGFSFLPSLLP